MHYCTLDIPARETPLPDNDVVCVPCSAFRPVHYLTTFSLLLPTYLTLLYLRTCQDRLMDIITCFRFGIYLFALRIIIIIIIITTIHKKAKETSH